MEDMLSKFENFSLNNNLLKYSDNILVAFSGGPDSVFLLHMLNQLKGKYSLGLGAFHLNHKIRSASGKDAEFSREVCDSLGVDFYEFSEDIIGEAAKRRISTEEAGRAVRYEIIDKLLEKHSYNKAATGHHMDDNAETVLMRLIRGTGSEGIGGIKVFRNSKIIRPLLCFTKSEIVDYLKANNIRFVTDESNGENEYFRNRIRNKIMPLINEENPRFSQSIMRLCEVINTQNDFLNEEASKIVFKSDSARAIADFLEIRECHKAVRYIVLKRMAESLGVTSDISFAMIEEVNNLIEGGNTSWDCDIRGCVASRRYGEFMLQKRSLHKEGAFVYEVKIPSVHIFADSGIAVKLYKVKNVKNLRNKFIKYVDYDTIKNNLVLRSRREGDKFVKCNGRVSTSLKKYFIDIKISRELRSMIPLLTEGDNIVCVCGFAIDDRYKITDSTVNILAIEYENYGE